MTTGPTDGDKAMLLGTLGVDSGKWYWEVKKYYSSEATNCCCWNHRN